MGNRWGNRGNSEERKKEFQSLVREILQIINLDNVIENLEFLEEFYHEIMKR